MNGLVLLKTIVEKITPITVDIEDGKESGSMTIHYHKGKYTRIQQLKTL